MIGNESWMYRRTIPSRRAELIFFKCFMVKIISISSKGLKSEKKCSRLVFPLWESCLRYEASRMFCVFSKVRFPTLTKCSINMSALSPSFSKLLLLLLFIFH